LSRIAVIADVHGNRLALEAVLADIREQGADATINLGDHLSGPLEPAATADLLMSLNLPSIRGNHDRQVLELKPKEMGKTDRFTINHLRPEHLEWLRAMPVTHVFEGEVFMTHGTPQSDTTYWLEHITRGGAVAMRPPKAIEKAAAGYDHPVLLCGHTHTQRMVRLKDGRIIVNPGSVGVPAYHDDQPKPHLVGTGAPDARYALIERRGASWSVTLRVVPYDHRAAAELCRQNGRKDWARALSTGWAGRP
jgi:predicted phosphodiesterase